MDDARLKKDLTVEMAGPRESERRAQSHDAPEPREDSVEDMLERYRQNMYTGVLPDLPEMPGFHVCWLSTTHPSDTIPRRLRMGYQLIPASELEGMDHCSLKTGEYVGCIGINEMVAARIPQDLYLGYMHISHHEAPRDLEVARVQANDALRDQAESMGAALIEGEGDQELRRSAPSRGVFV